MQLEVDLERSGKVDSNSCLVDSDNYLFALYRYIKMNRVRAGMVDQIAEYRWSSYHHNALGIKDKLITELRFIQIWAAMLQTELTSTVSYFDEQNASIEDKKIVQATGRGEVHGYERFHVKIAKLLSQPNRLASHGGDRKSEDCRNQAG